MVGSIIFGLYLYFALNVFGLHANEAFSALRIPDYKGFLRFRIKPDGTLGMWLIGIDRVPTQWTVGKSEDGRTQIDPAFAGALPGRVVDHFTTGPADKHRPED